MNLRSEPVDINRVLRSCDKIERHAANARQQMFNVEYNPDLPPVRGDEKALRRAVCALIENAIKYTPENGMIVIRYFDCTVPLWSIVESAVYTVFSWVTYDSTRHARASRNCVYNVRNRMSHLLLLGCLFI